MKAETLAGASGSTLGEITAIVESPGALPMPLGDARETAAPLEPGTQRIEATVSVTYAIG